MTISAPDAILLVAAGFLGGIVGTAGGITSLVSYPALLAAGLAPLPGSVENPVAYVACWPGAALASQPELVGRRSWLARWAWVTAAGGGVGSALLLLTPPGVFERVVPFLVAAGSIALLAQPRVSRLRAHRVHDGGALLGGGLIAVSVYNGYFGAGSGVMAIALLLVVVEPHIARANAL